MYYRVGQLTTTASLRRWKSKKPPNDGDQKKRGLSIRLTVERCTAPREAVDAMSKILQEHAADT